MIIHVLNALITIIVTARYVTQLQTNAFNAQLQPTAQIPMLILNSIAQIMFVYVALNLALPPILSV